MNLNFGNKETEKIWNGIVSKKFPREIQEVARRKLRMINNSMDITDLRIPPANQLEKLNYLRLEGEGFGESAISRL